MNKPSCHLGTACGLSCISQKYNCTSIVSANGLSQLTGQSIMTKWSGCFDNAPPDVRRLIASLDDPIDLSDGKQGKTCYSDGDGIYMGSTTSPQNTYDQFVFRHEWGHYADKQLKSAKAVARRHYDFEVATGGSTVADIQYYADKYLSLIHI
jgi:hypothetical protein